MKPKANTGLPKDEGWKSRPTYNGTELGRTCHRPGAYDFMTIPSMRNGERVQMGAFKAMSSNIPIQANFKDK